MTSAIKGTGQLRHRFFLDYSAMIGLRFQTGEEADVALARMKAELPEPFGTVCDAAGRPESSGVMHTMNSPDVLIIRCNAEDLLRVKKLLVSWGARESDIDSCSRSIDFGLPFQFEIPLDNVPAESTITA